MTVTNSFVPPPELVKQWLCSDDYLWGPLEQTSITITNNRLQSVAAQAAQWGANQELEACCIELTEKIITNSFYEGDKTDSSWRELASIVVRKLRASRRPKPPSLKEQALAALEVIPKLVGFESERDAIRRALEALSND